MTETMDKILKKLTSIEDRLSNIEKCLKLGTGASTGTKKTLTVKKSSTKTKKVIVQTGSIEITKHPNVCRLTGDTYDKKQIIKECKGYWTPEIKGWTVKISKFDDLYNKLNECTKNIIVQESDKVIEESSYDNNSKNPSDITSKQSNKKPSSMNSGGAGNIDFLSDSDD